MSERTNETQRQRRARKPGRIDYYPSPEARAFMESLRGFSPFNNASGILNAILADCMASGGIKKPEIFKRTFPVLPPYRPEFLDTNARARMTSERVRVVCGARTKAGHPCPT
jgi:hypothetical protein